MATEACSSWKEKLVAELYGELAPEQEREELRAHCGGARPAPRPGRT
jgi:hypothetical protein